MRERGGFRRAIGAAGILGAIFGGCAEDGTPTADGPAAVRRVAPGAIGLGAARVLVGHRRFRAAKPLLEAVAAKGAAWDVARGAQDLLASRAFVAGVTFEGLLRDGDRQRALRTIDAVARSDSPYALEARAWLAVADDGATRPASFVR